MKLELVDISLNSSSVDREFMHCYCTFSSLTHCSTQVNDIDKLDTLVTFVSPSVMSTLWSVIIKSALDIERNVHKTEE